MKECKGSLAMESKSNTFQNIDMFTAFRFTKTSKCKMFVTFVQGLLRFRYKHYVV